MDLRVRDRPALKGSVDPASQFKNMPRNPRTSGGTGILKGPVDGSRLDWGKESLRQTSWPCQALVADRGQERSEDSYSRDSSEVPKGVTYNKTKIGIRVPESFDLSLKSETW